MSDLFDRISQSPEGLQRFFMATNMKQLIPEKDPIQYDYHYKKSMMLAELIARRYLPVNTAMSPCNEFTVFSKLMHFDLTRVFMNDALVAWLDVIGYRHDVELDAYPEDLFYGLVAQYPKPVMAYANFIASYAPIFFNPNGTNFYPPTQEACKERGYRDYLSLPMELVEACHHRAIAV